jgi:hypothetical protein
MLRRVVPATFGKVFNIDLFSKFFLLYENVLDTIGNNECRMSTPDESALNYKARSADHGLSSSNAKNIQFLYFYAKINL